MNRSKVKNLKITGILWCLTLLLLLCLSACNNGNDETDTKESESESISESVSADESGSESETDEIVEPDPALTVGDAEIAENFTPDEIYHVTPTHKSGEVTVTGTKDDPNLLIKFDTTYYGTESAVDRDTFHWGNIVYFQSCKYTAVESAYVLGDFDGDRRSEQIYMDGTILTMLKLPSGTSTAAAKVAFTQDLGEEMTPIGTGFFNDDLMTDIILLRPATGHLWIGYGTESGFDWVDAGVLPGKRTLDEGDRLFAGDLDGDGVTDMILINDLTVNSYKFNGTGFEYFATSTLPFAESGQFTNYVVTDMNSDKCADVIATWSVVGTAENGRPLTQHYMCSYLSRRDGHFGSYEAEGNNQNINPVCKMGFKPTYMASGDVDGDGVDNLLIMTEKSGKTYAYLTTYPTEAPAYDYSSHVIKVADGYILYSGGLFQDHNTDKYGQQTGDHPLAYFSKDGIHWYPNLDGPCLYTGLDLGIYYDDPNYKAGETGVPGTGPSFTEGEDAKWWVDNTMEPEVVYDENTKTYYMYYQCEAYCYNEDGSPMGADRIGVATSTDGVHFERKTDRPALLFDDIYSTFTHQEVIYVPDDPDGLCWWMYIRYVHKNNKSELGGYTKFIRVRSDDPLCFDMSNHNYDEVTGFQGIGNQIGYVSNYDGNGNRLFLRIISREYYLEDNKKRHDVPGIQYSFDGLTWYYNKNLAFAGADMTDPYEAERPNVYFLGFSTINGTGELERNENGDIEFVYVSCTSTSAVAPEIFYSSEGVGKATLSITVLK